MGFSNEEQEKRCIFCLSTENITREHAVSRNLFPDDYFKGRTEDLIIVPTCRTCNQSYSHHEELFRTFLITLSSGEESSIPDNILKGKIKRSMEKAPGKAANLLKKMAPAYITYQDGTRIPKALLHISEDDWKIYHRIIQKYTKCLFFYTFKQKMPDDFIMKHAFYERIDLIPKEIQETLRWNFDHQNVYSYGYANTETMQSVWVYVFYGKLIFLVIAASENDLAGLPD